MAGKVTRPKLMATMRRNRWTIYQEPYKLNIVGVRADSIEPNRFDDTINVFYRDQNGKWQFHSWPATTDPGTYWLGSPMHPQGTAIMCQQQVVDSYGIAKHRDKYYALCQIHEPVCVIRDYDRDAYLDFQNGTRMDGMFGINIHRASARGTTKEVDRYSAGCQVFANADDFQTFMQLCETHRSLHDNYFTYSLIDRRAMARANRRKWLWRAGALLGLAAATTAAFMVLAPADPETDKPVHGNE